jgi:hypothetical protein
VVCLPNVARWGGLLRGRQRCDPEVVGDQATLFEPGDWFGLAAALRDGPLSRPAGDRVPHDPERVRRFSTAAAADRLSAVYGRLLS